MHDEEQKPGRYVRAVRELKARGHGATWAHQLIRSGLLPTFQIGRMRFAYERDIDAIPDLLKQPENVKRLQAASYDVNPARRRRVA